MNGHEMVNEIMSMPNVVDVEHEVTDTDIHVFDCALRKDGIIFSCKVSMTGYFLYHDDRDAVIGLVSNTIDNAISNATPTQ